MNESANERSAGRPGPQHSDGTRTFETFSVGHLGVLRAGTSRAPFIHQMPLDPRVLILLLRRLL